MSSLKEELDLRKLDLVGNKAKQGMLIEVEAARMLLSDLTQAARIAADVALTADVESVTIEDVVLVNNLFQAYIGPAYRVLLERGEVEPSPVLTTPSSTEGVKSKADLAS